MLIISKLGVECDIEHGPVLQYCIVKNPSFFKCSLSLSVMLCNDACSATGPNPSVVLLCIFSQQKNNFSLVCCTNLLHLPSDIVH